MAGDESHFMVSEAHLIIDEVRRQKSGRMKTLGSPILLSGKALDLQVRGGYAWIAENTSVARKVDLESGKTLQLYRGHTGPVTTLAFSEKLPGSRDGKILITGSWDRAIKLWDTETKELLSSTSDAHGDFVKGLIVFQSLNLLVSSGSDKIVRFWDLSVPLDRKPLKSLGSISSHTRPVECMDGKVLSPNSLNLYTADTMGVIKCWLLTQEDEPCSRWRSTLQEEFSHHRTRINEMFYGDGCLWTASSDETAQVIRRDGGSNPSAKPTLPIIHPAPVRSILPLALTDLAEPYLITGAGDLLRVYDLSNPDEPELVRNLDAHWHDITAIRLWRRETVGENETAYVEPWVITTSLDGTIRKWRLSELLIPPPNDVVQAEPHAVASSAPIQQQFEMTEEEERELAELLNLN